MDVKTIIALLSFLVAFSAYVFNRFDKAIETKKEVKDLITQNKLELKDFKYQVAVHYASKDDLKSALHQLKETINERFNRLEKKLDREKNHE